MPEPILINIEQLLPDLVPKLMRRCWQIAKLVVPAEETAYDELVFKTAITVLEDQLLMLHRKGYMVPPTVRSDAAFSCAFGDWMPNEQRIWVSSEGWYQRIRDRGGEIPREFLG